MSIKNKKDIDNYRTIMIICSSCFVVTPHCFGGNDGPRISRETQAAERLEIEERSERGEKGEESAKASAAEEVDLNHFPTTHLTTDPTSRQIPVAGSGSVAHSIPCLRLRQQKILFFCRRQRINIK